MYDPYDSDDRTEKQIEDEIMRQEPDIAELKQAQDEEQLADRISEESDDELVEGVEDHLDYGEDDEIEDGYLTPEGDFEQGMRAGEEERNEEEELFDEGGYGQYEERPQGVSGNRGAPLDNGWFDASQPGED